MLRASIIINVYNGETTLRETIDSVLAQTHSNWELIIWDDGSSDGSADVIASYDDSRIRSFGSEENCGLGLSRIAALDQAVGEWVGFLDQDDLWTADKLALQFQSVDSRPNVGFVYGRALKFYPDGTLLDYDHRHEFRPLPDGDIFEQLFVDSCFIANSTVLFRRSAFRHLSALPTEISTCLDYYMYLDFAREFEVAVVQKVVCYYRLHEGNMSVTHGVRMQREILQIIDGWSDVLPPKIASRRHKVHSTVLAVNQFRVIGSLGAGLRTLLIDGDVGYLLSRPFVRVWRVIRRRLRTPYWVRSEGASQARFIVGQD